jgi:hypothetical protein
MTTEHHVGYYTASIVNSLQTFRDNISDLIFRGQESIKEALFGFLTLEDGTR